MANNPQNTQPHPPTKSKGGPLVFSAWILAITLIAGAIGFLVFSLGLVDYEGPTTPIVSAGVGVLSLPFFVRWSIKREERWALLAWWVFFSIAVLLGILALAPAYGQVLIMIALVQAAAPFAVMFFTDRARWWAAIPAYVLVAASGLFSLTIFDLSFEIIGAFALLAVALPLWLLYMLNRSNMWAIVPAAIISGIALLLLLAFSLFQAATSTVYVIVNATLALMSFALWLTVRRFDWAVWLGTGFAAAAAISVVLPAGTWAMLALSVGGYIIYRLVQLNTPSKPQPAQAVQTAQPTASAGGANPPLPTGSVPSTSPANAVPAQQQPPAASSATAPPAQPNPHWRAIMADKAASESAGNPPEEKKPVAGFRPLDPLANRKQETDTVSSDEQDD